MNMAKNNSEDTSLKEQLNAVVALLLILVGEQGQKELLKKRRANRGIVKYLDMIGLSNKDLAAILNAKESSIRNMKAKKPKKK